MKLCLRCNQYYDDPVEKCPSDGTILEHVGKDPLIGALINNRYLVDSVIGKGSSGIVYKARRLGRGQMIVAIKVLHSYMGAAGAALDRFLREAQAASQLRNPHIITIWDSGVTEDGQPYFVMDYLEGTTLGSLIKEKGNLDPQRVVSLLHQICEALAEAHRQGIVHRDLKPENIILQESDHGHDYVKLLDFGIADSPQHAQSSFKLEKPRTVSGSPAYMSPEQCQGFDLDGRSDIYSLSIVVFEMLTGRRPFMQKNDVNVMVLQVNEPPMTLADVRPDMQFPQAVEDVLAKALSKQSSERQDNVQDFLLEFEAAWQNQENSLRTFAKAVKQKTIMPQHNLTGLRKEECAQAITSDQLCIEAGGALISALGNISLQSSGKSVPFLDNSEAADPYLQSDAAAEGIAEQQITQEPSIIESKIVDRLMETAKRGQLSVSMKTNPSLHAPATVLDASLPVNSVSPISNADPRPSLARSEIAAMNDSQLSLNANNEKLLPSDNLSSEIKPKYRNTLLESQGQKKDKKEDPSLISSSRVRAAVLKASEHPPLNLWRLSATIFMVLCLFVAAFVAYIAWIIPAPQVVPPKIELKSSSSVDENGLETK